MVWIILVEGEKHTMYVIVKRVIDFVLSLIALIVLSPLFLILAIWIKSDSPGPVFFRQKRVGKDKTLFQIYKFRTMRSDTPKIPQLTY